MMRVLIVSPHFPPTNAADHQRVRLVLPYLQENGWDAEVLAVDSADVAAPVDPWLAAGLPPSVKVHRVRAWGLHWSRIPGFGRITGRAMGALRRAGDQLLEARPFDLIYFSTTQFGTHVLGPHWKAKFGIPFAMDYQDPWVSDYYREHPEMIPPGGRWRFALADWVNRFQEPRVLRRCSGITAVSADYPRQLAQRYAWLKLVALSDDGNESAAPAHKILSLVLPFPGSVSDLEQVAADGTRQEVFSSGDGNQHWIYVGRGGADMELALRGIFGALQKYAQTQPDFLRRLRLHFIGTSYAAAGTGKKTIEPLAADYGLSDIVRECPGRLPYSQAMRCLLDADALIVPGSDDPAYTASKIYPYLLAEKPLLAVFHERSSVVSLLERVHGGVSVPFRSDEPAGDIAVRIGRQWLEGGQFLRRVPLDLEAFTPHTAPAQAIQLAQFFASCAKRN